MRRFSFAILLLMLLCGCAGNPAPVVPEELIEPGAQTSPVTPVTGGIPAPSKMVRSVSDTPVNASGRIQLGTADTLGLDTNPFEPTWLWFNSPQEIYRQQFKLGIVSYFPPDLPLAYKGYCFDLAGYDGELAVTFSWATAPAAGNLYLAAADFTRDRWDWYCPADPALFTFPAMDEYLNERGQFYLLVMVLREAAELDWIRVGGNAPPFTDVLLEGPVMPQGPLVIDMYWGCFDADGELASLEYDLDGDGSFETEAAPGCYTQGSLNDPGSHTIGVRATDDEGLAASAQIELEVNNWQAEVVAAGTAPAARLDSADNLHLIYTGTEYPTGYATNASGGWELEQLPASLDPRFSHALALDSHDTIYASVANQGQVEILRRAAGGWEEACPVLEAEMPDYQDTYLELGSDGKVHYCAATSLPLGVAIPADPFISTLVYWTCSGDTWTQQYTRVTDSHSFGFNLGADQATPQFAVAVRSGDFTLPLHGAWDPLAEEWVEQFVSTSSGAAYASFASSGGTNYLLNWAGLTLYSETGGNWQWKSTPNIMGCVNAAVAVDEEGVVHTVFAKESYDRLRRAYNLDTLMYATLGEYEWQLETVMVSELGKMRGLQLLLSTDGTTHIFCASEIPDDARPTTAYAGLKPGKRILHIWR